jgi:catalase
MNVLSDLGIPRDVRHIAGAGVHTYRFINQAGQSTLFKWYWQPQLGLRSLVYDEATKIAGKNNNFQRVDLFNSIAAGLFPKWDLLIQLFPDDGTYLFNGIDLLDPTKVVPNELNQPLKFGTMTLNRNPTNFFSEPESITFAPSNVVNGVTFVPDALLQWRLMSYDDTHTHRLGSPNNYLLPVNKPIAPINNNFRDGYMQPEIYIGASTSSPDGIGGVIGADAANTLKFGNETVNGAIGRYPIINDDFTQAASFWNSLDPFAQQHTVDAYRFELGNVANSTVVSTYINEILNQIDNCLARRVAFGVGAPLPAISKSNKTVPTYPSEFKLANQGNLSVEGLVVGILADDSSLSAADLSSIQSTFAPLNLMFQVVAPRQGHLSTGVVANSSYITTSSIFYDALIIGGAQTATPMDTVTTFVMEAFGHGKSIAAVGMGTKVLSDLGLKVDSSVGLFAGSATAVAGQIVQALMSPGRFPQRNPLDSPSICR